MHVIKHCSSIIPEFFRSLFSDKGKPLVISADLYVEAFGNIKEANMVSLLTTVTTIYIS